MTESIETQIQHSIRNPNATLLVGGWRAEPGATQEGGGEAERA